MSEFSFSPAVRDKVSLIIIVSGASGSGKTLTSLLLARGLADGDDSKIAFIDTESGRARHYAPAKGEKPSSFKFAFMNAELNAPFTPEAYIEAIEAADAAKFAVIVVDSFSHEWEGHGGLKDIQQEIVEESVDRQREEALSKGWSFNAAMAAEKAGISAWKKPKERHKKLVGRLLRCRAHLILAIRADEKMRMETVVDDRGRKRTVITAAKDLPPQERWSPICEKRLPYEATISFLLTPDNPGVPIPLKLQDQHQFAFPEGKKVGEQAGVVLGAWAKGGQAQAIVKDDKVSDADAFEAAQRGAVAFREFWSKLPKSDRVRLSPQIEKFKRIAADADAHNSAEGFLPSPPATGEDQSPLGSGAEGAAASSRDVGAAPTHSDLLAKGDAVAKNGMAALDQWLDEWLDADEKKLVTAAMVAHWRTIATTVKRNV